MTLLTDYMLPCHTRGQFPPIFEMNLPETAQTGTYRFVGALLDSESGELFDAIAQEQWELKP